MTLTTDDNNQRIPQIFTLFFHSLPWVLHTLLKSDNDDARHCYGWIIIFTNKSVNMTLIDHKSNSKKNSHFSGWKERLCLNFLMISLRLLTRAHNSRRRREPLHFTLTLNLLFTFFFALCEVSKGGDFLCVFSLKFFSQCRHRERRKKNAISKLITETNEKIIFRWLFSFTLLFDEIFHFVDFLFLVVVLLMKMKTNCSRIAGLFFKI